MMVSERERREESIERDGPIVSVGRSKTSARQESSEESKEK